MRELTGLLGFALLSPSYNIRCVGWAEQREAHLMVGDNAKPIAGSRIHNHPFIKDRS